MKIGFFISLFSLIFVSHADIEYETTIKIYYNYIHNKQYNAAYDLLCNVIIKCFNNEGKGSYFNVPKNMEMWKDEVSKEELDIFSIFEVDVNQLNRSTNIVVNDCRKILNMRCYKVEFVQKEEKSNFFRKQKYIWLIKGTDNKVRILYNDNESNSYNKLKNNY